MPTNKATTYDPFTSSLIGGLAFSVVILLTISYFGRILYDAFFRPLSRFPGPKLRAVSKLPGIYTTITGRDAFVRSELHEKYGPVVRVNPTEISFTSGAEAWEAIYGFKKQRPYRDPQFYAVGVNGCADVVTADEENHSRQRKILSTGFSDKAIKGYEPSLKSWVQTMITKMFEQMEKAGEVDMCKYLNCATFDIMGGWVFHPKDLKGQRLIMFR
jgi:cytochrome P450